MPTEPRAARAAWLAVAATLLLPSLIAFGEAGAATVLAWRPELWLREPWRWWSAAWLHQSALHLAANLAGLLLVAALGLAARVPRRAAWAWALAWPLTHLGLLCMPALQRYGGLSGVLHAGVAVVAVVLLRRRGRAERWLGAAIALVLVGKILSETPWRGPLVHPAGWDVAVAPIAHASGVLAGAAAALLCLGRTQPRRRRSSDVVE